MKNSNNDKKLAKIVSRYDSISFAEIIDGKILGKNDKGETVKIGYIDGPLYAYHSPIAFSA